MTGVGISFLKKVKNKLIKSIALPVLLSYNKYISKRERKKYIIK